jgi:predicted secreted hydrolase
MYTFPRDFGSHPNFLIEWWYVTGWLSLPTTVVGFQTVFFRRYHEDVGRHVIFGDVALSDPLTDKLIYSHQSSYESLRFAHARQGETDVTLNDWSLKRNKSGSYDLMLPTKDFTLDLTVTPTQQMMIHECDKLLSSDNYEHSDYYYSEPQLRVRGRITRDGVKQEGTGVAWLDHQWTNGKNSIFSSIAEGWDWVGANLDDGSTLMCFRIRGKDKSTLSKYAIYRSASGEESITHEVEFIPIRYWKSQKTGVEYPVEMCIKIGVDEWIVQPLFDDQELALEGFEYWEGASRIFKNKTIVGRGYFEMNGYGNPVVL